MYKTLSTEIQFHQKQNASRKNKKCRVQTSSTSENFTTKKGTLHVVQLFSTDIKYQSQSFNCKNNFQEMSTVNKFKHTSTNLPKDSISCKKLAKEAVEQTQKQESNKLTDYALVHKVHPSDRPLRNNVPEREKCTELDDILAKWNIYKPKK